MAASTSSTKKNKNDYLFDIDFKEYYVVLTQQKGFIFIFCCAAMLTSLALTYFFSEKYVAGTNIYYRPIETSVFQKKDTQAFGSPAPTPPFKVIVQTLHDIVKSDTILLSIVEKLHLDRPVKRADATGYMRIYDNVKNTIKEYGMKGWSILKYGRIIELEPTNKAIQELRKNFKLSATKESYVYLVTVKDKFPDRAAVIVDEIAAALVTWLRKQDVDKSANRLQQLERQLNEKEILLNNLRVRQEDLLNENNLVEVAVELARIIENLYGIKNKHIQLVSEIEQKKRTLESYSKKLHQKATIKIHPDDLKKIESAIVFEKIELKGLLSKKTSFKNSMDKMQKRMQQMLATKKHIESLDMKIEANTREYIHLKDMFLENLPQISIGDSEVEVMHPANVPARPVQPIKIFHVGLTAVMSLFFSAGLIYIFAFFNIRIFFASQGIKARKTHQ